MHHHHQCKEGKKNQIVFYEMPCQAPANEYMQWKAITILWNEKTIANNQNDKIKGKTKEKRLLFQLAKQNSGGDKIFIII